ncbi:MAG: xylulokinase [Ruminococcaceae bacterium]|nr:xylulokinase [Oscillospiraceae bacterium]
MGKYVIAHDLGTSGNKATLYGLDGKLIKSTVYSYGLKVGENNAAEQNADDWWKAVCETTKLLVAEVNAADIAAVSFSGQMMGCLCVDDKGTPLYNSLIWADMRSTEQEANIRKSIANKDFYNITGHRISSSYSATKFMWLKDNEPEVYKNTYKMLNAKDYIIFKLTGVFVTEPSDASSTCLMDLNTLKWSDTILDIAGIDKAKMPEIVPSISVAGKVTKEASALTGLLEGTPVVCGGGDGCCAAVGTGIVKEGVANCCLGTSSWISLASKKPIYDENMVTFNFAHIVPGYTLPCGTMQTGGGALSWAVDALYGTIEGVEPVKKSLIYDALNKEVENSPVGAKNLLFLPYLIGERSPRWNPKAKGTFAGLTLAHTRGDMARAVMEGVGYNFDIILNAYRKSGSNIDSLILIGGGARNKVWQQILADILSVPVLVPNYLEEATSMGAAITAGVGVGAFEDFSAIDKFIKISEENTPNIANKAKYDEMKALFDASYEALVPLFEKL